MTKLYDIDDIPACCLSCVNYECFDKGNISERKYAEAVEEDEDTGKEICPFYVGSEDRHEYD